MKLVKSTLILILILITINLYSLDFRGKALTIYKDNLICFSNSYLEKPKKDQLFYLYDQTFRELSQWKFYKKSENNNFYLFTHHKSNTFIDNSNIHLLKDCLLYHSDIYNNYNYSFTHYNYLVKLEYNEKMICDLPNELVRNMILPSFFNIFPKGYKGVLGIPIHCREIKSLDIDPSKINKLYVNAINFENESIKVKKFSNEILPDLEIISKSWLRYTIYSIIKFFDASKLKRIVLMSIEQAGKIKNIKKPSFNYDEQTELIYNDSDKRDEIRSFAILKQTINLKNVLEFYLYRKIVIDEETNNKSLKFSELLEIYKNFTLENVRKIELVAIPEYQYEVYKNGCVIKNIKTINKKNGKYKIEIKFKRRPGKHLTQRYYYFFKIFLTYKKLKKSLEIYIPNLSNPKKIKCSSQNYLNKCLIYMLHNNISNYVDIKGFFKYGGTYVKYKQ